MLPTVSFFGHEVTRLIVGDNPFNGYSYIADTVSDQELLDYHTEERVLEALARAEALGYNTLLPLGDPFMLRTLRHFAARGGKMQLIFQPYMAVPLEQNLAMMQQAGPLAVYHQGTTTDNLFESGDIQKIRDNLALIRRTGLPVGLGTHRPDVIERSEEEGWDVDFYVACLQNARLSRESDQGSYIVGPTRQGLRFYPEDRSIMLDLISRTSKPCIAYKIFAGGQVFHGRPESETENIIREVYREVFAKIKPYDIAAIGVYQGHKDQLAENARLFKEVMAE